MRSVLIIASLTLIAGCATLDNSPDGHTLRSRLGPSTADAARALSARSGAGPLAQGPLAQGPLAHGPPAQGPLAHGPAARGPDGWVVTVTPQELAALGFGQQMELDVQAPGVVYVVDYARIDQLDGVFARTAGGLLPLRALLKDKFDAGRVVLRSKRETPPASQPVDDGDCGA